MSFWTCWVFFSLIRFKAWGYQRMFRVLTFAVVFVEHVLTIFGGFRCCFSISGSELVLGFGYDGAFCYGR